MELLADLAARYRTVGAVSGRPVAFLAERLPPALVLSGLYGLESLAGGERRDHPEADRWRPIVAAAVARAEAAAELAELQGLRVEPKGLSLTLHYRGRPELAELVDGVAQGLAGAFGLEARPAKMSVELHPPIDSDKGTAVAALAAGASAVLYAGDDHGDLAAFDALDDLARHGVATVRVAVGGGELPAVVADRADLVVPSPAHLVALLTPLAHPA